MESGYGVFATSMPLRERLPGDTGDVGIVDEMGGVVGWSDGLSVLCGLELEADTVDMMGMVLMA